MALKARQPRQVIQLRSLHHPFLFASVLHHLFCHHHSHSYDSYFFVYNMCVVLYQHVHSKYIFVTLCPSYVSCIVYKYLSIYLSIYLYLSMHMYIQYLSLSMYTQREREIYIYIRTYIYIYVFIHIYIYLCDIPSYTPAVWFLGRVRLDCWPGPLPCPCWASKMPRGSCRWRWVVAVVPESCSLGPWGPKDSGLSWDIWVAEVTQIYGITIVNGIWGSFPSHF